MTSTQPDGNQPYTGETLATPTSPKDVPPEQLALLIAQREEEVRKLKWAKWVDNEYMRAKNVRQAFERQWYLNLAFTAGKQYVTPMDSPVYGFRLTVPKAPPWRVRLVVNKIRTAVIAECSKLTTSKPVPTVLPSTNETEDYAAAAVGEQLLKSEFATSSFERTYRQAVWWSVVCGNSFLKMYYDPNKKDYNAKKLPEPPMMPGTQTPLPDDIIDEIPKLREYLETPQPAQGKICIERITPFHIYVPDILIEDMEAQPFVIHVMTKTPLWVKNRYGFEPNPDSRATSTILDAATIIAKGSTEQADAVLVKEVWIKPGGHEDFPKGGILTIINGKVVQHSDKWPYPFPEYPFYKIDSVPTGGFYSDSKVTDLIPIQKEYNKTRSQALEIKNVMGKPKILYPKGSLNPKQISSEPGQSIPYIPGFEKPDVLPAVEVPATYTNEILMLQQEFDDISHQHEISRGQTNTPQLTSGTAIAYLQEQDDAKLTYPVASIENAIETLGSHYLHMVSHYWEGDRLIKIAGRDRTFEALHWKKGMLQGNHDVKVQTGSALPFSKAARTALVTEMMQNGFLDSTTGLEMMNFGGLDKALDEVLVDKRQAMRENLKMSSFPDEALELLLSPYPGPNEEEPYQDEMTGMQMNGDGTPFQPKPPVPVNSWDDHQMHIHWHNHFRKSQEFEQLGDAQKQAFELHVQMHQFALQSQMLNQQGQEVIPPGAEEEEEEEFPDEEGDPSQETEPPTESTQ